MGAGYIGSDHFIGHSDFVGCGSIDPVRRQKQKKGYGMCLNPLFVRQAWRVARKRHPMGCGG